MQITVHDENRLVLHQGPWGLRAMGVLFAALGFGTLWYITHGHLGEHNAWVAVVVGASFGFAGLAMAMLAADLLCTFDKAARSVTVEHRRLVKPDTNTYDWSDISDAALEKTMMSSGNGNQLTPVYRPVFVMKDGTRTPWTAVYTGDLTRQGNCVAAVRAFTGWHALPDQQRDADVTAVQRAASGARRTRRVLFSTIGLFVVAGLWVSVQQVRHYLTWQPVRARITSTDVTSSTDQDGGTSYRPVVWYAYRRPQGDIVLATGATILTMSSSYAWAEEIRRQFAVGDSVTAYINPASPSQGFLIRQLSWLPLVFIAIPLLMGALAAHALQYAQRGLTLAGAEHVPILDDTGLGAPMLSPAAHLGGASTTGARR